MAVNISVRTLVVDSSATACKDRHYTSMENLAFVSTLCRNRITMALREREMLVIQFGIYSIAQVFNSNTPLGSTLTFLRGHPWKPKYFSM